jgi:hypothetical protein
LRDDLGKRIAPVRLLGQCVSLEKKQPAAAAT